MKSIPALIASAVLVSSVLAQPVLAQTRAADSTPTVEASEANASGGKCVRNTADNSFYRMDKAGKWVVGQSGEMLGCKPSGAGKGLALGAAGAAAIAAGVVVGTGSKNSANGDDIGAVGTDSPG